MKMLAVCFVGFVGCVAPKPAPTNALMSRAMAYDVYWQPKIVQFQDETWNVTGHHFQFGHMVLHIRRGGITKNVSI